MRQRRQLSAFLPAWFMATGSQWETLPDFG
jgi:hypothetical protein